MVPQHRREELYIGPYGNFPTHCPQWASMNIVEKKRTSKLAEYCLQCFSPTVVVKNKTDSNKHSQKRCSVSRRKKHKHTCLNTSCLEHSWICSKHADENRPLIEAHYKEFSIWDQQIPAQTSETHMDSTLDLGKSSQTKNQAQRRRKRVTPQKGPSETHHGVARPTSGTDRPKLQDLRSKIRSRIQQKYQHQSRAQHRSLCMMSTPRESTI